LAQTPAARTDFWSTQSYDPAPGGVLFSNHRWTASPEKVGKGRGRRYPRPDRRFPYLSCRTFPLQQRGASINQLPRLPPDFTQIPSVRNGNQRKRHHPTHTPPYAATRRGAIQLDVPTLKPEKLWLFVLDPRDHF
jgi:hypothetical protein